jgi:hypothetical protein
MKEIVLGIARTLGVIAWAAGVIAWFYIAYQAIRSRFDPSHQGKVLKGRAAHRLFLHLSGLFGFLVWYTTIFHSPSQSPARWRLSIRRIKDSAELRGRARESWYRFCVAHSSEPSASRRPDDVSLNANLGYEMRFLRYP